MAAGRTKEPERRPPSGAGLTRAVGSESPPAATAPREGSDDEPPVGPPSDAATTFEDLPGDLFGEDEWASDVPDERPPAPDADGATAEAGPVARGTSGARSGGEARPEARPAEPVGEAEEDDVLAAVGRLFPGRIVALEPLADERGTNGSVEEESAAGAELAAEADDDD